MKTFLLRRAIAAIPLIIVVTFITQAMLVLSPGTYYDELSLTPGISQETIQRQIKLHHLDTENVVERYWYWLWPALRGEFGYSFRYRAPVWELIGERVANTLLLTVSALIFSWGLAIPLGALAALYRNGWIDKLCSFISFFGLSIPSVFFSLLMVMLAARTGLFPVGSMRSSAYWDELTLWGKFLDVLWHLALPTLVLGTIGLAQYMRQMRSEMIETLSQDFIRTARAKGLRWRRVVFRHALLNAINPLVTMFGFSLAFLLAGSLLVEHVFAWPGLGTLIYESLSSKDEPMVMAAVTMLIVMLVVGNLIADLLLALIDPRIRLE
jgi:peptide/nickel transport system permease protein